VVVTNALLVDDRRKHILDELRCLGYLIQERDDWLTAIDTTLIEFADTEAFVGKLTRDAVLAVEVRHPHRAIGQLSAVDGVNSNVVGELGHTLELMEQRGLADAVLTLHDYCALVTDSGDEVDDLRRRKN
jgi:hypothetical protein